jgi:hypothetical protein
MRNTVLLFAAVISSCTAQARAHSTSIPQAADVPRPANPSPGATFAIRLSTDRSTYAPGEPIAVTFVLQNTAGIATSVLINHAAHLDLRLVVRSGTRTVRENLPFRPEASSGRGIDLGAGGTFTETEPLSTWLFSLPPGTYDLSGEFYYPVNGVPLKTNVVRIVVTP